jgi:ribonuclease P protein component
VPPPARILPRPPAPSHRSGVEERQLKGTLKSRRAFQHIYEHGRRAIGAHVVVFAIAEPVDLGEAPGSVGIVASRKVGHSPDRSRAKRVLRAALREVSSRRPLRGHLILVARRALIEDGVRSSDLARELEPLLEQAGSLEGVAS